MIKIKGKYLLVLLTILIALSGCKKEEAVIEKTPAREDIKEEKSQEAEDEEETEKETEDLRGKSISPLSGIYVEDEKLDRRVMGIMFDNHPSARWQAGLKDAEVVYEYQVEAPYTRYLAFFLSNDPELLGPLRSARPYFVTNILEYDALYVRVGGSREADADILKYNIDQIDARTSSSSVFWRKSHKKAPNNLYSDMKTLRSLADGKGLNEAGDINIFEFNLYDKDIQGSPAREININYNSQNKTDYLYNEEEKQYYRKKDGQDHIDEIDKSYIKAKNIIIREVETRPLSDGKKLEMDLLGNGKGKYITNGNIIDINWTKKSREEKTRYTLLSGQELKLNPGVTFIQVVNPKMEILIKE